MERSGSNGELVEVRRSGWRSVRRLSLFLAVAVLGVLVSRYTHLGAWFTVENMTRIARDLGPWGPVVLLAAGIISPLLFLPRWPIALVCGLLYGTAVGTLYASFVSTLGAWLHFMLSRTLLAPLTDRMKKKYHLERLNIPREKQFMFLFFMRAFPLSSFVATNLMAGALRMSRSRYVLASFLGMLPSSWMYATWGKLMKKTDSPKHIAVAVASVILIAVGTFFAQRYVNPWIKQISDDRDKT